MHFKIRLESTCINFGLEICKFDTHSLCKCTRQRKRVNRYFNVHKSKMFVCDHVFVFGWGYKPVGSCVTSLSCVHTLHVNNNTCVAIYKHIEFTVVAKRYVMKYCHSLGLAKKKNIKTTKVLSRIYCRNPY